MPKRPHLTHRATDYRFNSVYMDPRTNNYKILIERIRALKISRRFDDRQLMHLTGLKKPTVERLYCDKNLPSPYSLEKIARALNADIDALFADLYPANNPAEQAEPQHTYDGSDNPETAHDEETLKSEFREALSYVRNIRRRAELLERVFAAAATADEKQLEIALDVLTRYERR